MAAAGFGGARGMRRQGGRPVLAQGFGVKNLVTGEPVDVHTAFEIGSCSKTYAAAAA
jgi:CubicO group peptidase (beta-lactamase class C family)